MEGITENPNWIPAMQIWNNYAELLLGGHYNTYSSTTETITEYSIEAALLVKKYQLKRLLITYKNM